MIPNDSASSCGRLICNRPTLPLGTTRGKKKKGDGREKSAWAHRRGTKAPRTWEGRIPERRESGICQLKQFFSLGIWWSKTEQWSTKRQISNLCIIHWYSDLMKVSLMLVKYILPAAMKKTLPIFLSEHFNGILPGLHLELSIFL